MVGVLATKSQIQQLVYIERHEHKICWIHLCRWKSCLFSLWACLIGSLCNFLNLVCLQNWEEKRKKSCQAQLHIVVHIWFWQQDYRTMCMICNFFLLIRRLGSLAYRRCHCRDDNVTVGHGTNRDIAFNVAIITVSNFKQWSLNLHYC
jgi:hypothetical protein